MGICNPANNHRQVKTTNQNTAMPTIPDTLKQLAACFLLLLALALLALSIRIATI